MPIAMGDMSALCQHHNFCKICRSIVYFTIDNLEIKTIQLVTILLSVSQIILQKPSILRRPRIQKQPITLSVTIKHS